MTPDQYRREGFQAGIEAAAKECDRIAGNTADFSRDHRRAAGQCAAMIRAIDVDEALAGLLPVTITGGQSVVAVCPICDIAGCRHIREAEKAPDAVARLVEAANQARMAFAGYVPAQTAINKLDEALAAMETNHD